MDEHRFVKYGWLLMAAIAGAMTSRSFQQWKTMERPEIAFNLFVSAVFSVIAGPAIAERVFGHEVPINWLAFIVWASSAGSIVLIPIITGGMKRLATRIFGELGK